MLAKSLLEHFGCLDSEIRPTVVYTDGRPTKDRHQTCDGLLAGRICRTCNSGWMEQLEKAAKPTLLDLASSRRQVRDLELREQLLLARWAVKTSLALHATDKRLRVISDSIAHETRLRRNRLANNCSVFAFQTHQPSNGLRLFAFQSQDWFVLPPRTECPTVHLESWKISLRIDQLHLLFVYWPAPLPWRLVGWRSVHMPLWPTRPPWWYDASLRHSEAKRPLEWALALFHVALGFTDLKTQRELALCPRPSLEAMAERLFAGLPRDPS